MTKATKKWVMYHSVLPKDSYKALNKNSDTELNTSKKVSAQAFDKELHGASETRRASYKESEVIQEHAALVKRIAQHLLGRLPPCVQIEDLIQSGMMGLLEAFKNYDVSKGASFATYASIRIRGSMLDEIRKGDWAPRSVHRNTRRISQAMRQIENSMGRDARGSEIAENLNITLQEYHYLLQESNGSRMFAFHDVGLSEEIMSEGISITSPSPLEGLQQEDFRESIAKGIEGLPERERMVLVLYYNEGLNLREVGEVLGVSESRVSQIQSQAMHRLQGRLKDWDTNENKSESSNR